MHNQKVDSTKPIVICPGPTSAEGKQISSRNALRHGCCAAETLILKTENIEDYKSVEQIWFRAYEPKDEAEKHLVRELINADWFLQRSTRILAELEASILETSPNPLGWDEHHNRTFARFLRYQTTRANNVNRCRKAIEDYRAKRAAEKLTEQKIVIKQERHDVFKEKSKPEPTVQEILDRMMAQKAERDLQKL